MATVKYVLGAGGCYRDGRKYLEGEMVEVDESEKPGRSWRKLVEQARVELVPEALTAGEKAAEKATAPVAPSTEKGKQRPSDKGVL